MADWETYAIAAERLGMTTEAIRHRSRRSMWRRMRANDGKTLIMVPDDVEPVERPVERPAADSADDRSLDQDGEIKALLDRIADLQADIVRQREDRDRERDERIRERNRADEMASEVTALAGHLADLATELKNATTAKMAIEAMFAANNIAHQADLDRLNLEAETARAALAEFRSRPWWRRMAG